MEKAGKPNPPPETTFYLFFINLPLAWALVHAIFILKSD